MAEWPPTALTTIADPPTTAWPDRVEVGPLTLVGPTGENQQPEVLDTRTETLRGIINSIVAMMNVIQDHFLDRDGDDAPIDGSTQGSYYMRGDFDMGGFKIVNLADGVSIRDAITFEQLEDLQFEAEDTVEQILLDRIVFQDGSVPMLDTLDLNANRAINLGSAAISTDAVRKDTVDTEIGAFTSSLLRRVGTPEMLNHLSFDNAEPTEDNYQINNVADPINDGDLANKGYFLEQIDTLNVKDLPIASVIAYAGPSTGIPSNFLLCDGREVSRFTYQNLYNVIGIAYGSPSSGSVFHLPDLRGRAAFPLDNMGGQTAGRVTQISARTLGGFLGLDKRALLTSELPAHTHTYDDAYYADGTFGAEVGDDNASDANNQSSSSSRATDGGGSGVAHNNMQPSMAMNYLIRS